MIRETTFFGVPLQSRRKRRLIVVAYYGLVGALPLLILAGAHWLLGTLLSQTFILGTLLGGLKSEGPVKRFEGADVDGYAEQTISLNLNGGERKPTRTYLDEREIHERDHAHYRAYGILRWMLATVAVGYWLMLDLRLRWLATWTPVVLWTLLLVALSLPQAVLLWTEPDTIADGDLQLLSPGRTR